MSRRDFIFKAFCVALCVASSTSSSREEVARDFIEHVLRIPNPDKVLNSVLGSLEKNKHQRMRQLSEDEDCEDPAEALPEYTESLQVSRERGLRQLGPQKHYPICHLERKIKKLNTNEYEYRPPYYEEVRCVMTSGEDTGVGNEICTSLGFSCVQWNKTIHLTRRRYTKYVLYKSENPEPKMEHNKLDDGHALFIPNSSEDMSLETALCARRIFRRRDCWETRTMVIPAGCECMWPVHRLGDIKLHV